METEGQATFTTFKTLGLTLRVGPLEPDRQRVHPDGYRGAAPRGVPGYIKCGRTETKRQNPSRMEEKAGQINNRKYDGHPSLQHLGRNTEQTSFSSVELRSERPGGREPSHFDKSQRDGREHRQLASFVWINCSLPS